MQVEITGKVIQVLPEQRFNGKNGEIVKNSFVIEWSDNGYNQHLCLDVMGATKFEKMEKAVRVGNDVLVRFSVSSREYNQRWFTSCQCFYCSNVSGMGQQQQSNTSQNAPQQTQLQSKDDGMPF